MAQAPAATAAPAAGEETAPKGTPAEELASFPAAVAPESSATLLADADLPANSTALPVLGLLSVVALLLGLALVVLRFAGRRAAHAP